MGHERDAASSRRRADSDSDFECLDSEAPRSPRVAFQAPRDEMEISAGLAAEELRDETLYAGDTIEYYSMAFVFGDKRGYRVAKVLKVAHREREYPLRLDSQEMLPNTLMIKRKLTRRGEELEPGEAVWRKIRTFELVDGQVLGKTRADRLNEGLKNAVSGAFRSLHSGSSTQDRTRVHTRDLSPSDKSPFVSNFLSSKAPAKKGLLEVTSRPSSKFASSSKSEKKQQGMSAFVTMNKRPRVELTPSPSTQRQKDRDTSRPSQSNKHKDDKRLKHGRSPNKHDERSRLKVDLMKYVNQVEEARVDPTMDLNSYLALVDRERDAIHTYEANRKEVQQEKGHASMRMNNRSSASKSLRMQGGDRRDEKSREKSFKREKSLHNFYKGAPRAHPAKKPSDDKPTGASKLNFFLDTENDGERFVRSSKLEDATRKSHSRGSKSEATKIPKKKGLSPTNSNMDMWISRKR